MAVPIQLLLTEFDTDNNEVCIPPCRLTPNCVNYINLREIPISSLLNDKVLSERMLLTHLSTYRCTTTKDQCTIIFNFQTVVKNSREPTFFGSFDYTLLPSFGILNSKLWCTLIRLQVMMTLHHLMNHLKNQPTQKATTHGKLIMPCRNSTSIRLKDEYYNYFLHNVILK